MFHTYEETLNFLYENLPMFQRVGASALKPDLTNTLLLCEALGNPQLKFKSIHVGGTNGKGSTSHMLASILQCAGFKTGLYTSPHLKSFTERIRINGEEVSKDYIIDFVNRIFEAIHVVKPSFFEITVAMAFDYFASQKVDIAVVEVGLGGRLDSTNVITPELSLITNIGWDHMDLLGDSLEKIAGEKAGIIKNKIPVVISERQREVEHIFLEKASSTDSPLYFASDEFTASMQSENDFVTFDVFENGEPVLQNLAMPLQGVYQQKNIPGVLEAVKLLRAQGWEISQQHVRSGLENVISQTGLKGRWQVLNRRPMIVCDTGHNLDGMKEVLRQIRMQSYENLFFVFGMVKGKDVSSILRLLPKDAYYFFCEAKIPRAMDASTLFHEARQFQLNGEIVPDVNDAIHNARTRASDEDMIFVGGSTYIVAEINTL
ncbi:MAG TPA: folylpolyglutamate synthase/dihydrofolate synthase family protein [Chryseolinea sp.]|nr:folylpolyglutamate synthase/dihydrofolate synthase family protein [Chryseolinea sp.]